MQSFRQILWLVTIGTVLAVPFPTTHGQSRTLALSSPQELPDQQPQVLKKPNPLYPEILKRAGIQGDAYVKISIDEHGKVDSATVIRTSHEAFGMAAKEVAMKWEFTPAMKNGKPIRSEVVVPFRFALAGDDEFYGLVTFATDILRGKVSKKAESQIDPDAYAVVGHAYEPLHSILFGKNPPATLVEGENTSVVFSSLKADEAKKTVLLVLFTGASKQKVEHLHTVVFMKAGDGQWKLKSWHASN